MTEVTVRVYGSLNDFLPPQRRQIAWLCVVDGRQSVKDLIESLGVPHPEIDLILVNGTSVPFDYAVQSADRIAVFPRFTNLDIGTLTRVRPRPLDTVRFVADVHLGKLARRLRLVGLDTAYRADANDAELAELADREGRILLTRDQGLLKRRLVAHGYYVRETLPHRQLVEVLRRFGPLDLHPFSRCLRCNDLRPRGAEVGDTTRRSCPGPGSTSISSMPAADAAASIGRALTGNGSCTRLMSREKRLNARLGRTHVRPRDTSPPPKNPEVSRVRAAWRRWSVSPRLVRLTRARIALQWRLAGKPVPPPNVVKQHTVIGYQKRYRLRTFVETGTYTGEMVHAISPYVEQVISIEVEPTLHARAVRRFAGRENIRLLLGDSATLLPIVIESLDEPALFWLDGHYMGGESGRGAQDTPIIAEMTSLLSHHVRGHVVLIDDARLFDGTCGYPRADAFASWIAERRAGTNVSVDGDIIRCVFDAKGS